MPPSANVSIFIFIALVIGVSIIVTFFRTSEIVHHQLRNEIAVVSNRKKNKKSSHIKATLAEDEEAHTNDDVAEESTLTKKFQSNPPQLRQEKTQFPDSDDHDDNHHVVTTEKRPPCTDLTDPKSECRKHILSSPVFSDFREYTWPNVSQLLHESPVRFQTSFKSPIGDFSFPQGKERQQYLNRQVKKLQCSYDDENNSDEFSGDEKRKKHDASVTTVRIYVPWKSYSYMTPYPLVCPSPRMGKNSAEKVNCELTNLKQEIDADVAKWKKRKSAAVENRDDDVLTKIDAYVVDSNGAYVNEVYDWPHNPLRFVLVAFNTENIEGRRVALQKGYGLRYLAKPWNTTWWSYFHVTASYQRHSQVMINFFHWSLCRDESFLRGYRHWARSKLSSSPSNHQHESATNSKSSKNQQKNKNSIIKPPSKIGQYLADENVSDDDFLLSFRGKLKHKTVMVNSTTKQAPILFFVRNCDFAAHRRNGFMKRLEKFVSIDSVGKCHTNRHPKSIRACDGMKGNRRSCMIADFGFYLSIENSISLDYVSEKVYEPLLLGTIPIYLGAPNVADFLPARHSAIIATDFKSLKQLAEYVKCIMKNQSLYEHYTSWYERPLLPAFEKMIAKPFAPLCDVCLQIAELKKQKNGNREEILNYFDDERNKNSKIAKSMREPGVSGEVIDYEMNSQAPLKQCLKDV